MNDSVRKTMEDFLTISSQELDKVLDGVSEEQLNTAFEMIRCAKANGNRVHLTGIGKPSYVAGYIASLMSSTGTPAYVLHGTEAVHGSSGQLVPGDVVIAISNSGQTEELKATVNTVRNNGMKVIAVTGNSQSWLAENADAVLNAHVDREGGPLNKAPRMSYIAEILVLQALSVMLQAEAEIDLRQYKKWHPGGALGASIKG